MAQLVEYPTLAQGMILWLVSLSPASDTVLTAQSLEPALDFVSPSLSASSLLKLSLSLSFSLSLSLSLSKINKHEVPGCLSQLSVCLQLRS